MSLQREPALKVRVDATNPGQFFACCGLLELADRFWGGAEGWFEKSQEHFCVQPLHCGDVDGHHAFRVLQEKLTQCQLANTMTTDQLLRRDQMSLLQKKEIEADEDLKTEKRELDSLWRESPILFRDPFGLRIDWFRDIRAGGSALKTWAGQQSVFDIASEMRTSLIASEPQAEFSEDWLLARSISSALPFYFDSDIGGAGDARDVGFSFDPLKTIAVRTRPRIEFLAFVGLQRFRPARINKDNRYRFWLWYDRLVPILASAAACGALDSTPAAPLEFRLLYRTKYLKSFLPAIPTSRT